ncbi:hypothetical protein MASR1M60_21440 [Rhodocyclaceae bacterium]
MAFHQLDAPHADIASQHANAIVTIAIGETYLRTWERLCKPGWLNYATRHGFDLIVITAPLDDTEHAKSRSPAWQKLLILNQPWATHYQRIVWLDADIIISHPQAPDILLSADDPKRIGICAGGQLGEAEEHIYLEKLLQHRIAPERFAAIRRQYYAGLYAKDNTPACPLIYQTGVMALNPARHNDLFLRVYAMEQHGRHYEQIKLSREIWENDLAQPISARFNWCVLEEMILNDPAWKLAEKASSEAIARGIESTRIAMSKGYFLHFAGAIGLMKQLHWDDQRDQ